MQKGKLTIRPPEALVLSVRDADVLLEAGNGDAALLFLHILRSGGVLDAARAATALHRSDREIEQTAGRLRQMGLLTEGPGRAVPAEPVRELPDYSAQEVVRRSMDNPEFQGLLDTVQMTLGRKFSGTDLKKLFGIYDELGMPADVILLLVQYCKERSEERYGPGRTVSMTFVEKEAYSWANREILTHEQADQWIAELQARRSAMGVLKREMGISGRELTKTEQAYIAEWLELGFPVESIAIAWDRTVTGTGKLSWKYMDSIIRSWESMGLHTPEQIEQKDPRTGRRSAKPAGEAPAQPRDDGEALAQLARIRERMRNGT